MLMIRFRLRHDSGKGIRRKNVSVDITANALGYIQSLN